MRRKAIVQTLLMTGMIGFALACAENPAELTFEPTSTHAYLGDALNAANSQQSSGLVLLEWKNNLNSDETVAGLCQAGQTCTLSMRKPSVNVTIPASALSQDTYITVTALAGKDVNFEFGPHGTLFNTPISVEVAVKDTKTNGAESFSALYWMLDEFGNPLILDQLPAWVDGRDLHFETDHFSGYALAM